MRERILKAATHQIAERGYEGMTLQAVADHVGVRKPSVLHHFPSKEKLHAAALWSIFEHWNHFIPEVMLSASRGASRFDSLVGELVRFFSSDPDTARVVLREMLDSPHTHRKFVTKYMAPWFEMIGQGIENGKRQGHYRADTDTEMYIVHVLRLIIVVAATSTLYPPGEKGSAGGLAERDVKEIIRLARMGLLVDATPPKR